MPVLPTISDNVKFESKRQTDVNAKVVDRPNVFRTPMNVKMNKRTGYPLNTSVSLAQQTCLRAGSENGTSARELATQGSATRLKSARFQHSPQSSNPLSSHSQHKEYTLPMRGRVGLKQHHQDPQAVVSHLARKRCNGHAFERQFGSHTHDTTTNDNAHRGKRIFTPFSQQDSMQQHSELRPETLRATSRYAMSRRFDVPQMIKPSLADGKAPVLVTGREVFRRTNTTLEGVFYPSSDVNIFSRPANVHRPPYHVE